MKPVYCLTVFLCLALQTTAQQADTFPEDRTLVLERVASHPLSDNGLSVDVEVLDGDALRRAASTSLGETLARRPGIRSAQFGTAVGRPVIRGLGGPRVRIMEDRIDTMDVSVTSADHATTIEPFLADRIEVFKGPSVLLFGSGAIGGVVDVHTGRIPRQRATKAFSGRAEGRYVSNSSGYVVSGRADGGAGNIAWHVDALSRNADDYTIPVFAESRRQLEQENEMAGDERILAGSRNRAQQAAAGVSWLFDGGLAGVSVSGLTGLYGLPGGHAHEEEGPPSPGEADQGDEFPTLDMQQARFDGEISLTPNISGLNRINARFGAVGYSHEEKEPNGDVATRFSNDAFDSRVEAVYDALGHSGAVGAQYSDRNFSATGEEAFISPVRTQEAGVFWVGEREFGPLEIEAGARLSQVTHAPENQAEQSYMPVAASLGAVYSLGEDWRIGVNADYSRRAPVAEELYSNGPHLTTASYERGNSSLNEESAIGLSATVIGRIANATVQASVYRSNFTDFIFRQNTGQTVDNLPEVAYMQADAVLTGLDAHASVDLPEARNLKTRLNAMFDWVVGERTTTPAVSLPRIPPWRAGVGFQAEWKHFHLVVHYIHVSEASATAPNELGTDAYDDLSLWVEYCFEVAPGADAIAFMRARNLTDAEQRDHTSFIKDTAPQPGRTLEAGFRIGL